jgi:hypothetical protein
MANPSITQLDGGQIFKRVYDETNDAVRVEVASGTTFAIGVDAADGDNLAIKGLSSSTKASITNANTGTIVAAADCSGYKAFNIYIKTTSTISGSQACTLEVSPHDTDNVWIATSVTATPSGTNGVVVAGTASSAIVARRARVTIAAAITSGTFDIYLVQQGV